MHGGGKYSHRFVDGWNMPFNYDVSPDTHEYKAVDLDKIITSLILNI